jgi:hypothetical protein
MQDYRTSRYRPSPNFVCRAPRLSEVLATTLDVGGGFLGGDPTLRGACRRGVAQRVWTELGRFLPNDEASLWRAATWYINYPWRLRAQDAARVIRELRLGRRIRLPGE